MLLLLAFSLMLFNHFGKVFDYPLLVFVGSFAFPVFAVQFAISSRLSRDLDKFLLRLVLFAVISQYPYCLMSGSPYLNILFTFSLFLSAVIFNRGPLPFLFVACVAEACRCDGGFLAVILLYLLYLLYPLGFGYFRSLPRVRGFRYLFYILYPAHLMVLGLYVHLVP